MGYDERWAQCSPGIQLTLETIRYVFEQGLEGYEFLGSEESWQMTWPHDSRAFLTLALYPISIRGLVALTGDLRRVLVRKAQRFVPNIGTRMNRKVQKN
jgi:CelD/BcsL family acetyltransferase involved in cellulose biosynthesis